MPIPSMRDRAFITVLLEEKPQAANPKYAAAFGAQSRKALRYGALRRPSVRPDLVHHRLYSTRVYSTRAKARPDLFSYVEGFYNRRRRHSCLGYLSPKAYKHFLP
jgi:transposase InsO family protein